MRSIKNQVSSISRKERGFTILLAALVASLVLAIGISVFTIAQKQVILSSLGRNSQYAFYAADTGAECGLYWDLRYDFFGVTAPPDVAPQCDDQILCPPGSDCANGRSSTFPYTMSFEFEPNGYCVQVTVTKATVHPRTRIHADGFSVPCVEIESSARALQRSVEMTY